jgi:Ion channel
VSGDAFFTLGYGDLVPTHAIARLLIIFEAGTSFGFIALTVSYLPVLYQHFATRDVRLIELAMRADAPPDGRVAS